MEGERSGVDKVERTTQILNELNMLYKDGIVVQDGWADTENIEKFNRIKELEAELQRLRPELFSQKEE